MLLPSASSSIGSPPPAEDALAAAAVAFVLRFLWSSSSPVLWWSALLEQRRLRAHGREGRSTAGRAPPRSRARRENGAARDTEAGGRRRSKGVAGGVAGHVESAELQHLHRAAGMVPPKPPNEPRKPAILAGINRGASG